mmetsp:Transcript_117223/g.373401  ORF Transcript_117223/g.373401 Transcript_117223/m.373401 type:complete len:207 (+) Transcript_117223:650-1270(+)
MEQRLRGRQCHRSRNRRRGRKSLGGVGLGALPWVPPVVVITICRQVHASLRGVVLSNVGPNALPGRHLAMPRRGHALGRHEIAQRRGVLLHRQPLQGGRRGMLPLIPGHGEAASHAGKKHRRASSRDVAAGAGEAAAPGADALEALRLRVLRRLVTHVVSQVPALERGVELLCRQLSLAHGQHLMHRGQRPSRLQRTLWDAPDEVF